MKINIQSPINRLIYNTATRKWSQEPANIVGDLIDARDIVFNKVSCVPLICTRSNTATFAVDSEYMLVDLEYIYVDMFCFSAAPNAIGIWQVLTVNVRNLEPKVLAEFKPVASYEG